MWQRSGASLFALVVLVVVVLEAAAVATLVAAFVLNALGRVPSEDVLVAAAAALAIIGGSVFALAAYIVGYHLVATAREKQRQERVRGWSIWWQGMLQYARREAEAVLPREAIEAFLDLRETLAPEPFEQLGILGDRYQIAARLVAPLQGKSQPRRLDALQDLARARLATALPAIFVALRDPAPVVRRHALRAAARTLARRGAGPELQAFVLALRDLDLPPSLLAESLLLLEGAAADAVAPILADANAHLPVLQAALLTAGRREMRRVAGDVLPWIDHRDPEVRAAALRSLAGMAHLPEAGEAAVVARVDDAKSFVRVHAVRAAVLLPRALAGELLWRSLGDPSWWVRLAAAEGLGKLGAEGRESLEKAAAVHPDRYARDMALQALADLRWRAAA